MDVPLPGGITRSPVAGVNLGAGRHKPLETVVHGGVVGLALDGRGRPLEVPQADRRRTVVRWAEAFDAYPR